MEFIQKQMLSMPSSWMKKMPGLGEIQISRKIKRIYPDRRTIILTAQQPQKNNHPSGQKKHKAKK